ncbi:hypothetical protein [Kribbella solani]|uniref:hypothetical protein n=1 Tax=Kribbella solani TaxID=236067 RepID=UPI0029A6F67D|nr:hypothetical protein [Kribbella solani]MDX2973066.1 hypothetical protein [Kribbella solani]
MGHWVSMVDIELRYVRIWRAAVGVLAGIGVLAALVFVSPGTNLVAFLVAALTSGAVCLSIGLGRDLPSGDLVQLVPRWGVLGGLMVLAVCGFAAAVGAGTLALLALIAAVSPPAMSWLRSGRTEVEAHAHARTSADAWSDDHRPQAQSHDRAGRTQSRSERRAERRAQSRAERRAQGRAERHSESRSDNPAESRSDRRAERRTERRAGTRRSRMKLPKAPDRRPEVFGAGVRPVADWPLPKYLSAVVRSVGELTDDELCLAWRRSFTQLQRAVSADRRQAMVDVRRAYLDELEHRHPDSFATWLASNPRAAGNPARFFTHRADH